jgi:peptidoglycan-associated lipoprotein
MKPLYMIALGMAAMALVLCPGCKKKPIVKPSGPEDVVDLTTIEPGELPLTEPPPITDFQEPENKEIFRDIHFDFDRSDIRPIDRPILEGIAGYLKANPKVFLLIEGHCDERGTNEYNLALGERRALSTRAYLANLGVEEPRMVTVTYGEEDPLDPGHTEESWAKNRRAHFKVANQAGPAPATP